MNRKLIQILDHNFGSIKGVKSLLNVGFVLIVIFSFLFQLAPAKSFANISLSSVVRYKILTKNFDFKDFAFIHNTDLNKSNIALTDINEQEFETDHENDDFEKNTDCRAYFNGCQRDILEISISTLFRQNSKTLYSIYCIPCFVLFHSWKSFIV
ncbi:MAG TPA: hypothetical protein PK006_04335 [Saprospiraceae bacterium]|nr:hypothetical protein [Saprospiraceae bacterium]